MHLLNHFQISNFGFYKVNSKTSKSFNGQWSILPFSNFDIDNFLMNFAEFIQLDCDAGHILEEYHNFKLVNMRFRETTLLNWSPHGGIRRFNLIWNVSEIWNILHLNPKYCMNTVAVQLINDNWCTICFYIWHSRQLMTFCMIIFQWVLSNTCYLI